MDNAVKFPDETILIPLNKKLIAKIRKPVEASSKVCGSFVNTDTINPEQSGNLLKEEAGTGDWKYGERFRGGASESDISSWIDSLGL